MHSKPSASPTSPVRPASWTVGRRLLVVSAALLTLVTLFYALENWRGGSAWASFQKEWAARGEPFELAAIVPKPVPDGENFATTPLLKPLLDYTRDAITKATRWGDEVAKKRAESISAYGRQEPKHRGAWRLQQAMDLAELQAHYRGLDDFPHLAQPGRPGEEVLHALSKYEAETTELRQAIGRPFSRFPLHYEENYACLLPHLAVLKQFGRLAELRAVACLDLGQTDQALAEVKFGLGLAAALHDEPIIISQLVRMAILDLTIQAIWEGMARERWTAPQLQALEAELRSVRLLASFKPCLRGERVLATEAIEMVRRNPTLIPSIGGDPGGDQEWWLKWLFRALPGGWFQQNKLVLARLHLEYMHAFTDEQATRIFPARAVELQQAMEAQLRHFSPHSFLAALLFPAISNLASKFAATQGAVELATAACVIEQQRLPQGQYPQSFEALPAAVRERLPKDLITGEPLHYARQPNGRYTLYSVGWDEKDEGGRPGLRDGKEAIADIQKGDWVWAYPER